MNLGPHAGFIVAAYVVAVLVVVRLIVWVGSITARSGGAREPEPGVSAARDQNMTDI